MLYALHGCPPSTVLLPCIQLHLLFLRPPVLPRVSPPVSSSVFSHPLHEAREVVMVLQNAAYTRSSFAQTRDIRLKQPRCKVAGQR